jgi:hypothetical protein
MINMLLQKRFLHNHFTKGLYKIIDKIGELLYTILCSLSKNYF